MEATILDRIKEEIPFIPLKTMINWKGKGGWRLKVSFEFTAITPNSLSQNKKEKVPSGNACKFAFKPYNYGAERVATFHVLVDRPSLM